MKKKKEKDSTIPEVKKGKQLSKKQLQENIRAYVPSLIEKTVYLANSADNDNARLGAIKLLLSKCVPDLKATELSTDDQSKFIFQIIKDTTLEDARDKNTTNDSKLPKTGNDISESSKV